MFDISFSEVLVIAAIALIVLGPERLPNVARTLGHLFGRAQRYVNDVKSDIQREIELDELKKWKASVEETGRSIENSVHNELDKFRETVEAGAEASAMPPPATAPSAAEPSPPPTKFLSDSSRTCAAGSINGEFQRTRNRRKSRARNC